MTFLSKSKYMVGLQCPQLLWVHYNAKEELPKVDDGQQAIFDQGNLVGDWAKKVFPKGLDVKWNQGFNEVIKESKELLKKRVPLFEAGFKHKNGYSRIDVLKPVGNDEWDIIEVKSGTKIDKKVNYDDVSFQKYCCEGNGLKIRKCFLMHINKEYVKQGEINPEELFEIEEISEEVDKLLPFVEDNINNMIKVIEGKKPSEDIGPHCKSPYECSLKDECWKFLPKNNIFDLVRIGKKGFELINEGIQEIKDIPLGYKLTDKQSIQKDCTVNNAKHIDEASIKAFLRTLKYPIHYFDFETINPVIPLYDGMKPYQHVPFQFSLHIQEEDGKVEHFEYLHEGKDDPRPNLLKEMKNAFQAKGSVVVYYQSFEKGKLKELAEAFPEFKDWVDSILLRFVDLYEPFSKFLYYDPKQKGSVSLKATMPSLTGVGYKDLEISNGGMTMRAYSNITFGKVTKDEKIKIRKHMLKYCGQDTEGMIWMTDGLKKIV
jgi:hypothetical protein